MPPEKVHVNLGPGVPGNYAYQLSYEPRAYFLNPMPVHSVDAGASIGIQNAAERNAHSMSKQEQELQQLAAIQAEDRQKILAEQAQLFDGIAISNKVDTLQTLGAEAEKIMHEQYQATPPDMPIFDRNGDVIAYGGNKTGAGYLDALQDYYDRTSSKLMDGVNSLDAHRHLSAAIGDVRNHLNAIALKKEEVITAAYAKNELQDLENRAFQQMDNGASLESCYAIVAPAVAGLPGSPEFKEAAFRDIQERLATYYAINLAQQNPNLAEQRLAHDPLFEIVGPQGRMQIKNMIKAARHTAQVEATKQQMLSFFANVDAEGSKENALLARVTNPNYHLEDLEKDFATGTFDESLHKMARDMLIERNKNMVHALLRRGMEVAQLDAAGHYSATEPREIAKIWMAEAASKTIVDHETGETKYLWTDSNGREVQTKTDAFGKEVPINLYQCMAGEAIKKYKGPVTPLKKDIFDRLLNTNSYEEYHDAATALTAILTENPSIMPLTKTEDRAALVAMLSTANQNVTEKSFVDFQNTMKSILTGTDADGNLLSDTKVAELRKAMKRDGVFEHAKDEIYQNYPGLNGKDPILEDRLRSVFESMYVHAKQGVRDATTMCQLKLAREYGQTDVNGQMAPGLRQMRGPPELVCNPLIKHGSMRNVLVPYAADVVNNSALSIANVIKLEIPKQTDGYNKCTIASGSTGDKKEGVFWFEKYDPNSPSDDSYIIKYETPGFMTRLTEAYLQGTSEEPMSLTQMDLLVASLRQGDGRTVMGPDGTPLRIRLSDALRSYDRIAAREPEEIRAMAGKIDYFDDFKASYQREEMNGQLG